MHFATQSRRTQILVWLTWAIVSLVFTVVPDHTIVGDEAVSGPPASTGVATHDARNGPLVPWQPRRRLRKWAWRRYCALQRARRRMVWITRLARLASTGALTMAQVVDLSTRSQLRRHLGALPVLYALLEVLQVREVINRHCPTEVTIIGDRANLNDELAIAYDDHGLRYLAGLQPQKKAHRKLLVAIPEKQFYAHPLTMITDHGATGVYPAR